MPEERKVTLIQHYKTQKWFYPTKVAIYCRVSTAHAAQGESLEAQIDKYKKMVTARLDWQLVDVYSDIASGKNTSGRPGFNRLMQDCADKKVDLILCKSISRMGRNTVEILENIYKLRKYDVDAFFEIEDMRITETSKDFLLAVLSGLAQEDSTSRSENIKAGIGYQLKDGKSYLYTRPCYGYRKGNGGELVIDEENAENVRLIFDLYLQGHSIVSIVKELARRGVKSPSGKDAWPKRAVETLLENEKYIGNVLVGKTYSKEFPDTRRRRNNGEQAMFLVENAHEPIISRDVFEQAKQERERRSNFTTIDGKSVRKDTHYSMKNASGNGGET